MQSDKRKTSNSYLKSVLVDGANPFYYRSGIRTLLGFPESEEGNMSFSPTLPAVGFRYLNHSLLNEPHSIQYPRNETSRFTSNTEQECETENSLVTSGENIQCLEPVEETSLKNPYAYEKSHDREISQQKDSIKDRGQQDGVIPELRQKKASGVLTEKLVKPRVFIERSRIEIPSDYESNEFFPALSPEKNDGTQSGKTAGRAQYKTLTKDTIRKNHFVPESRQKQTAFEQTENLKKEDIDFKRASMATPKAFDSFPASSPIKKDDTSSDKTKGRSQRKISPVDSSHAFIRKSLSEVQENAPPTDSTNTSISASERLQKADIAKEKLAVNPSQSSIENPVAEEMRKGTDQAKTAKKDEFSKRMAPLHVVPEEKHKYRQNQIPYTNPSRYIGSDVFNKSNRNAAERIEQLQHAVQRLASKVSSHQAKTNNETQLEKPAQMQPPPVQPVVIRKRFSNQTSTPSAFWERSYLSHFHLKTLR